MITHDTRFAELAAAPVKTIRVRFDDQTDETGEHDFASADDLMTATQTLMGNFLGVGTKKMEVKCLGDWSDVRTHHYDGYLAIWDAVEDDWNEIYLGQFVVDNAAYDIDAGSTVITMYDALYNAANTPYALVDDLFPCTVAQLAAAVATTFGSALDFSPSLPNAGYTITENLWKTINNATMYDVAKEIAEATATTVVMRGDTLTFKPYEVDDENMTELNLKKFKIGKNWGVLNSIVLSRMPQGDNIVLNNDASVEAVGATAFTAVNNEILDDERADVIQPIYDALVGTTPFIIQDDIEADTEGHGWYEIGDSFSMTLKGVTYYPIITEVTLEMAGYLRETIKSKIPDPNDINYMTAGGIMKSIWNTEIKVDKQGNEITSIVSRQDVTDQTVADNYTEIKQDIENVAITILETGGDNIIENSVGYALKTNQELDFWTYSGTGTVVSQSSPGSLAYGGVSGYEIDITGTTKKITQRIAVTPGKPYSLSFRAKKNSSGSARVKLSNTNDSVQVDLPASTAYVWDEFKSENIVPTLNYFDVEISSNNADAFGITDLMVNIGENAAVWSMAADEITSQNVVMNRNGITVKNSQYAGDFTQITPLEFAGYSNASGQQKKVFSLNRDVTVVEQLQANKGITMVPIKIIPITTGSIQGLAFVKNL